MEEDRTDKIIADLNLLLPGYSPKECQKFLGLVDPTYKNMSTYSLKATKLFEQKIQLLTDFPRDAHLADMKNKLIIN